MTNLAYNLDDWDEEQHCLMCGAVVPEETEFEGFCSHQCWSEYEDEQEHGDDL